MGSSSAFASVAKGSSHVFLGAAIGMFLQLLSGILVVRAISKEEYGLFSLAMVISGMLAGMSMLGFRNGVCQLLSRAQAKEDVEESWGIVFSSLILVVLVSSLASMTLHQLAQMVAGGFGKPALAPVLEFVAWLVMPLAVTGLLVSIFRALSISLPKVLFQEIFERVVRISGVILVIVFGWGLLGVLWANLLAAFSVAVLCGVYAIINLPKLIGVPVWKWLGGEIAKYCLPLFGATVVLLILGASSTMLLGYFSIAKEVAIYSAPRAFTKTLELPLVAVGFIYLPIATKMYRKDGEAAVAALYYTTSKWIGLASMPIFLLFLMDAEYLVRLILGQQYTESSLVLAILAMGSYLHTILGVNGMMLITFEQRNKLFMSIMIAASFNILLGVLLIPKYGATGAAIATASALAISNLFISYNLYKRAGIKPLDRHAFQLILSTLIIGILVYLPLIISADASAFWHLAAFLATVVTSVATPILLRSLDKDDIMVLKLMEYRFRRDACLTKKIAKWCGIEYDFKTN